MLVFEFYYVTKCTVVREGTYIDIDRPTKHVEIGRAF